eukprot:CCRYP_003738-RA/>CCRYP_003738-RA protein AED:0.05 eAED:0.05 QI:202/1/1/1/1/1/2/308/232
MPPARRSRRSYNGSNNLPQAHALAADVTYKKGDVVEFQLNGSTVTGRLVKKSPSAASPSDAQLWIVAPSDRRRKNEQISELELRKVDAADNPTTKRKNFKSGSSQGSKGSDENSDRLKLAKSAASSSETSNGSSSKKRKSEDMSETNGKKVTFQDQKKTKQSSNPKTRVGTRSTRNSSQELFDDKQQPLHLLKKNMKKVKNDENVTVVQMLTGTLYLYKGETRRAEFVRSKY